MIEDADNPTGGRQREPFGKLPVRILECGGLASMTKRSELAVYVAIALHVDGSTWSAYPSVATIMRLTGASERTVQRAIHALADRGLVQVHAGGGRGLTNTFTLATNTTADGALSEDKHRHLSGTLSSEKPRHLSDTLSGEKPRQNGTETPSNRDENPVKPGRKPRQNDP